jgi:hypothetical protein
MRLPGTDRQEVPHSASISHEYGQSRATRRHYIQTPSGYHARGGHAPDAGPLKPARWPSRIVTSAEAARWAKSNRSSDIWVIISAYRIEKSSDDHPYI